MAHVKIPVDVDIPSVVGLFLTGPSYVTVVHPLEELVELDLQQRIISYLLNNAMITKSKLL